MRLASLSVLGSGLVILFAACGTDKGPDDANTGATTTGATTATGGSGGKSGGSSKGGKGGKTGTTTMSDGGGDDTTTPVSNAGQGGAAPVEGVSACEMPWSEPPAANPDCDMDNLEDSGVTLGVASGPIRNITSDVTLESGKIYHISGLTIVRTGATLYIPKCVKIVGKDGKSKLGNDSGLVDNKDGTYTPNPPGRIEAVGEEDAPIVFTGAQDAGSRRPGDWGGLILQGKAPTNNVNATAEGGDGKPSIPVSEGVQEEALNFGYLDDTYTDEDDGKLEYVRVEFVGDDLGNGNETNGVTFNGVGSGTSIHHVMVSNSIDDCFEWFGGTVNAHHLVALNCDDDMFDTDLGFSGTVQFAFGRQYPTSSETDSNGFEWDGNRYQEQAKPYTSPSFSNVTLCGGNTGKGLANPRIGAILRRGARGSITNTIVTGFDSYAYGIQLPATVTTWTYSDFFDNAALDWQSPTATADPSWITDQDGNSLERPPGYCDCWANPPQPFPLQPIAGGTPGPGYPDPKAKYVGAFKQASVEDNWMRGAWVDWSEE